MRRAAARGSALFGGPVRGMPCLLAQLQHHMGRLLRYPVAHTWDDRHYHGGPCRLVHCCFRVDYRLEDFGSPCEHLCSQREPDIPVLRVLPGALRTITWQNRTIEAIGKAMDSSEDT